jgi:hypothetical protein
VSLSTRIISEAQHQRLEYLAAEGLLSGLSVGIAEKDIHVTDLLRNLSTLKVEHSHFQQTRANRTATHIDDGIKLIFAGGTCPSKAHGTIRRMSEDIDMKIVLETRSAPLAKDIGTRARLKALYWRLKRRSDRLNLMSLPKWTTRKIRKSEITGDATHSTPNTARALAPTWGCGQSSNWK